MTPCSSGASWAKAARPRSRCCWSPQHQRCKGGTAEAGG
jgi:hypothetical protein